MKKVSTSIITINYNHSDLSISCVNSILQSNYVDFQVVLVDNGSEGKDYQNLVDHYIDDSRVDILRIDKNCGYVGGVNHGITYAKDYSPEFFVIMNNDTIIDKNAIGELVKTAIKNKGKAIVTGKVYYFDNPNVLQHIGEVITDWNYIKSYFPGRNEVDNGQYDIEVERDALDDVFWLIPKEIIENVGLYCNYFFLYAEQGDYALRAKAQGYKLIFTPHAKLWHKVSMTTGGGNSKALPVCYWRGQSLFIFQYRHLMLRYFFISTIKNFIKYSYHSLFQVGEERACYFARLRGYLSGFILMLHKKENNGNNPYLKNKN